MKKHMKRIANVLLTISALTFIVACGGDDPEITLNFKFEPLGLPVATAKVDGSAQLFAIDSQQVWAKDLKLAISTNAAVALATTSNASAGSLTITNTDKAIDFTFTAKSGHTSAAAVTNEVSAKVSVTNAAAMAELDWKTHATTKIKDGFKVTGIKQLVLTEDDEDALEFDIKLTPKISTGGVLEITLAATEVEEED